MTTSSAPPDTTPEPLPTGRRREWRESWDWRVWCLAALVIGLLAPKIGSGVLWHHDELLTANRSREMLARGDFSTVTLNFAPDFRKPPLQYWLCAAALRALPTHPEFAVRLPALLAGAACLLAVAWLARRSYPDRGPALALCAAGALAGCGYFVHGSRIGLLDTGAALCLTLTVIGCQLARTNPRWWWFVGMSCVLGAWQKAPYGFGAWAVILLVRRLGGRQPEAGRWGAPHLAGAWAAAALVTAGWWLLQGELHGFGTVFAAGARQARALTYAHDPGDAGFRPYLYWFWMARDWAVPGLCAPFAVWSAVWPRSRGERLPAGDPTAELGWVCAVFAAALACVPFRAERYLTVITPLLALLAVRWLGELPGRFPRLLPVAGRRWVLPLAIVSTLPVASFHYFSKTPRKNDLLDAARQVGRGFRPGDTVVVSAGADRGFEVASFVEFYANLSQPWRELGPEETRALPPPCLGICNAAQVEALRGDDSARRWEQVRHGGWVVWERRD